MVITGHGKLIKPLDIVIMVSEKLKMMPVVVMMMPFMCHI